MLGDEKGPALWRVLSPCRALQERGYVADWCPAADTHKVLPLIAAGRYDVLVLPRLGFLSEEAQDKFFSSFRRAALTIVYEVDDDVFSPSIVQRQRGTVEQDKSPEQLEDQRQRAIAIAQAVDGLTVTSPNLAAVVRQYTDKPVEVVPNAIDTDWWRQETARARRRWKALTIGWVGGMRPGDDLRTVAEAWTRISDRHKRVEFVCSATAQRIFSEHVPKHRLHVLPWMPIDYATTPDGRVVPPYPHGMVNVDIGCAAVSPRLFNLMKCVVGETLVTTDEGLAPIESLVQTRVLQDIIPFSTRVWTTRGWAMTNGFYYGGEQDTIRITTKEGWQLEGTTQHPIRRADDTWALLEDIQIGDEVRIEPAKLAQRYVTVKFNPWAVRQRDAALHDAASLPTIRIDEHWAKVLGYIMGDGHVGKNFVRVSCTAKDEDVVADLIETYRHLGFQAGIKKQTPSRLAAKYGGCDVEICSARFNDFLRVLGVHQDKRKWFAVPGVILKSPAPVVSAFLRTLFESDGTASAAGSFVSYTTRSLRLAREVQLLLSGLGIFARLGSSWNKTYQRAYYQVMLGRAATDIYAKKVGFVGARKREALEAITRKPHSNRYRPQRWSDVVEKIERGKGDVFDLCVPGPAEFSAGGFMNHNTPIKVWEYTLAGAAVVATPTLYGQTITEGEDGLLAETVDEWETALGMLVENAEYRAGLQRAQQRRVYRDHAMLGNWSNWLVAWGRIRDAAQARHTGQLITA